MNRESSFDYKKADAQATTVVPLDPGDFPFDEYGEYEQARSARCREFWKGDGGVLVYRRMRVAECFSAGCADAAQSLRLQLGALNASMDFEADIPNFLEPWYGIGTLASACGAAYQWEPGQAPAVRHLFPSTAEALACEAARVDQTEIGRATLEMINYFMEQTHGRLPVSLTDTQSPLNAACMIVDINNLFMEFADAPAPIRKLLDRLAELQVDFVERQKDIIGGALVWPGHGFASSREFCGLGQSDDNILMLPDDMYRDVAAPSLCACGEPFGGPVFHSCGNWSAKLPMITGLPNLRMVDGAFSAETDPSPNPPGPFAEKLTGTGIVLNARAVGTPDTVLDTVKKLWRPGMKLIAVTYCETPEEQKEAYERIHELCD